MPSPHHAAYDLIATLVARAKARGAGEVIALAAERLGSWMWSGGALLIVVRPTKRRSPAIPSLNVNLEFLAATATEGRAYERDIGTDTARTFARRLTHGNRCFLLMRDRRVAHASWVSSTGAWSRELAAWMCPPDGDAYLFESYTRPEERGRGLFPMALTKICERLGEEGVQQVWAAVEESNLASVRALSKAGFETSFVVTYRRRSGRITRDGPGAAEGLLAIVPGGRPPPAKIS